MKTTWLPFAECFKSVCKLRAILWKVAAGQDWIAGPGLETVNGGVTLGKSHNLSEPVVSSVKWKYTSQIQLLHIFR